MSNITLKDVIIAIALFLVAGLFYRLWKNYSDDKNEDYKIEMENLIHKYQNKINELTLFNNHVQDSLNGIINTNDSSITTLRNSRIKNDHYYDKKILSVDSITNDSATDLRAELRRQFRNTHGY